MPRLASLVLLAVPAVLVGLVAHPAAQPRLVVPNEPDVTIKTRRTHDRRGNFAATEVLYLKGARQRREELLDKPPFYSSISQCDQRRTLMLSHEARTYAYYPIEDPSAYAPEPKPSKAPAPSPGGGPTITVTIDAVDTGERKQVGRFVARHVITTRTAVHAPGDTTVDRQDSWYIDIPESNCMVWRYATAFTSIRRQGEPIPEVTFKMRGNARLGYPVEETYQTSGPYATVSRIELVEISEAPLDDRLFTVPADYRPALPHPYGGYVLDKPDTLLNRVQAFRQVAADWTNYILRYGLQGILPGTQAPPRY